jgi:hypothetical protein
VWISDESSRGYVRLVHDRSCAAIGPAKGDKLAFFSYYYCLYLPNLCPDRNAPTDAYIMATLG